MQRPADFSGRKLCIRRLRLGQRLVAKIQDNRIETGIVLRDPLSHGGHEFLRAETFVADSLRRFAGT